jgi:excisionase family DNA binding protein
MIAEVTTQATDRLLLTVEEAAWSCSISRSRMWELVSAGVIPTVKIGRSRRVPADALRRWIEAKIADGEAA